MAARYVYKICTEAEWQSGEILRGSAHDRRDGFIHFSTAEQVPGTLAKYFASERDLVLLRAVTRDLRDRLRWEPSPAASSSRSSTASSSAGSSGASATCPRARTAARILPERWLRSDASRMWMPDDRMDARAWDDFWADVLDDRLGGQVWRDLYTVPFQFQETSCLYIEHVTAREGHRVLLAGNGISLEPHGFVHAGFDVTVVEASRAACRFVASRPMTPERLAKSSRSASSTRSARCASRSWTTASRTPSRAPSAPPRSAGPAGA